MPAPNDFVQIIRDLKRRVDAIEKRSPLAGSGMSVTDQGVVTVDGSLVVEGDFTAEGKIDNAALVSPVVPVSVNQQRDGFAVGVPWTTVLDYSLAVPSGFSSAVVLATSRTTAFMNRGTPGDTDYIRSRLTVAGVESGDYPLAVTGAGGSGTSHASVAVNPASLGATLDFTVEAAWDYADGGSPYTNNEVRLAATVLFLR